MTTPESNRATVLQFCQRLSRREFDAMAEFVTSDATWFVIGRTDYAPYAGLHTVMDVIQILKDFVGPFDAFKFDVHSSIAEDDRVAIEATSAGNMGPATYKNTYSKHFQLRDGKIQSVREFFDAYEITDYLVQLGLTNEQAFGTPAA